MSRTRLQHTTTHCNTLFSNSSAHSELKFRAHLFKCHENFTNSSAAHYNTLQHTTTYFSWVHQHTQSSNFELTFLNVTNSSATHYNTLFSSSSAHSIFELWSCECCLSIKQLITSDLFDWDQAIRSHVSWDKLKQDVWHTLQHSSTHCTTLQQQHTATLQCTTPHCNTLLHTAIKSHVFWDKLKKTYDTTHCNRLQHTATHCNTLQRTAPHCITLQQQHTATLQHAATHCNTLLSGPMFLETNSNSVYIYNTMCVCVCVCVCVRVRVCVCVCVCVCVYNRKIKN